MDKAELFAQVARRIGLKRVQIDHDNGLVIYWDESFNVNRARRWGDPTGWEEFDPITNPADERLIWDWLLTAGVDVAFEYVASESEPTLICCTVKRYDWGTGSDPCRVTALCQAIAALPEAERLVAATT